MSDDVIGYVHIEPAGEQRRAFAQWCLAQTPRLEVATATGTDVPLDLYPAVPAELLAGAYVDGYPYGAVVVATDAPPVPSTEPELEPTPRKTRARKAG